MVNKSIEDSGKIEMIMNAAQKRFGHYGLSKTTMSEIADDINMSKASLYYYFPDKEAIFRAVVKKEQDEFVSQLEKLMSKDKSASELVTGYVRKRIRYFREFVNMSMIRNDAFKHIKPICADLMQELRDKELELLTHVMKQGVEQGEFEKLNAQAHADLLITVMQGLRAAVFKKDIEFITDADYDLLEKNTLSMTAIFIKGISK